MASNSASKSIYCSKSSNPYTLKVSWSESSPSIANNTSIISISASLGASNVSWDSYYNSYLKIYWHDDHDGKDVLVATSDGFKSCGMGFGTKSVSGQITVDHKDDGSLNGFAKVVFEAGSTSGGWSPASNSAATAYTALTVIARASSFTISSSNNLLGSAVSVAISRNSDSFTHKVEYSFEGSDFVSVSTNATTSASFTPSLDLCSRIPNSTTGVLTVRVTTFNGSSQVGNAVTNTINLNVPDSVVPTMGTPTATRVDNGIPSGWGVYVNGYSKVTIAMTSVSGSYGSTIKSYSITGPNLSSTSSSATSNVLVTAGTNTYTCRITDSRGRTVTKSVSINVIDYSLPSIKATAVRCSSDGKDNKNGTYLKVTVDWNIASVSSKNSVSSRSVSCNGVSNTSFSDNTAFVLAANCSIGSSYTLTASVTDALGNSASATVTIPTSSRVMNVRRNKDGIAFGKFSEKAGFEVAWDSLFNGTLDVKGKLTGSNAKLNGSLEVGGDTTLRGSTKGFFSQVSKHLDGIDLNTIYTPGVYTYNPHSPNNPDNGYGILIVYVGVNSINSINYNGSSNWLYQIAIGTESCIFYRRKINASNFTSWIKVLDSSNYKDQTAFTYSTSEKWTGKYDPNGRKIYSMYLGEINVGTSVGTFTKDKKFSKVLKDCWIDDSMTYFSIKNGTTWEYRKMNNPTSGTNSQYVSEAWIIKSSDGKTATFKYYFGTSRTGHKYVYPYIMYTYQ